MKYIILLFTSLIAFVNTYSQLPATNYFYYASTGSTTMYNYNTTTNTSTVNSIALPSGNIGLAVNNNFFAGPTMTYWTQLRPNSAETLCIIMEVPGLIPGMQRWP
jgi:hypothetical protein